MSKRREEAIIAMETNLEVLRLEVAEAANQVHLALGLRVASAFG